MSVTTVDLLLVEDNPDDLELALYALKKNNLGNRIHVVRDGEEALDFMLCRGPFESRRYDAQPKLILLDLHLPKVGGIEVLRELKGDPRTKAVPIVVLSSSREQSDVTEVYRLGANSYIQKPVDFNKFNEIIRELGFYWLVVNLLPPSAAFLDL